jgi:hypothetical protein
VGYRLIRFGLAYAISDSEAFAPTGFEAFIPADPVDDG